MISCVLLAAGSSVRFVSPKALAVINQQPIIKRIQDVLIQSVVEEIIVVLGDHADLIRPMVSGHKKIKSVFNQNFRLGQTSSFQSGLSALSPKASGIMLLPVDVPNVAVQTVDTLIGRFNSSNPKILIPTCNGKKGHPPIFNISLKESLLKLEPTIGLNQFIRQHESVIEIFPVSDPGVVWSFNTPEEFDRLKAYFKFSP